MVKIMHGMEGVKLSIESPLGSMMLIHIIKYIAMNVFLFMRDRKS